MRMILRWLPLAAGILAGAIGLTAAGSGGSSQDRAAAVEKLLAELEARRAQYYNVPREDGRFLNLLVKASGAKRALEVGTANGYSAIWIGLGLEATGGSLTTIEISPEKAKEARANLAAAGLSDRVRVVEGDGHKVVRELEGPFDFVFLDADMGNDLDYLQALLPKLSPGGLLLRHNAIRYASTMKDFLEAVRRHPELDTVTLSLTMDDGFSVSYRKKK